MPNREDRENYSMAFKAGQRQIPRGQVAPFSLNFRRALGREMADEWALAVAHALQMRRRPEPAADPQLQSGTSCEVPRDAKGEASVRSG